MCISRRLLPICNGDCLSDENENGICDILELEALQTELADGVYCGEGTVWDESSGECIGYNPCPKDLDGDGVIGIEDLLQLLNAFGTGMPRMRKNRQPPNGLAAIQSITKGTTTSRVQIGEQCWFAENLRTELLSEWGVHCGRLGRFCLDFNGRWCRFRFTMKVVH